MYIFHSDAVVRQVYTVRWYESLRDSALDEFESIRRSSFFILR